MMERVGSTKGTQMTEAAHTTGEDSFPDPPKFTEEDWRKCRESGDYCPMLFEWYKYVGVVCNFLASIRPESPAVRRILPLHYSILIGLLNRCTRLMLANVALSHEGLFGETTAIIDRCIFESCVKVIWLCQSRSDESFTRFVADGLRTEVEFKARIKSNIAERGNNTLAIEKRMLASIERTIASSGLTEEQIIATKRLPDLAAMIESLNQDRVLYLIGQKIGSHHVHGTWPSLRIHYLEENEEGVLRPRDHDCETNVNQYVFIPKLVLFSVNNFVHFIFEDEGDIKPIAELLESIEDEVNKVNKEVVGKDFERAEV